MEIFTNINFDLDLEEFKKKNKIKDGSGFEKELEEFLGKALPEVSPKAIYKTAYIKERNTDKVTVENITFTSEVLARNLKDINRVFPYVVTCGIELEPLEEELDDYLQRYWLDSLKEMAARQAHSFLKNHLQEKYQVKQFSTMNPGSGDIDLWPIEQQQNLFQLLGNVEEKIGVRLTDSYLMVPNKSMSGIFFPSEAGFANCEYCRRENCPSRRAPYKGDTTDE